MPLALLLLLALSAGLATSRVARRASRGRGGGSQPAGMHAGRELGRRAARHETLRRALRARLDPQELTGLALTSALVVVVAGGLVLGALALVVRSTGGLISMDSGVADWGDAHATDWSTSGLQAVTRLGETWVVVLAALALAAVELRRRGDGWVLAFLALVVLGDKLITTGVKDLVDRARPALNPVAETLGPSFPSGHTSTAAAFWAAAALVAARWVAPRRRHLLFAAAVAVAVGVAASRVLLDVHWLTDVLGGLALGWAWFAVCAIAFGGRLLRFGAPAEAAANAAAAPSPR